MEKGIKKIAIATGEKNAKVLYNDGEYIGVEPDKHIWFKISEWMPGTTEQEKKKEIVWIRQNNQRKTVINQLRRPANQVYGYKFSKKECGIVAYYIEASLGGKPDLKNKVGKYIFGHCPPKIVDSKWSVKEGGDDVRKTFQFSYGHIIYLYLGTEGLNGRKDLTVEIYRRIRTFGGTSDDPLMRRWTNVEVNNGEINVKIQNTSQWKGTIKDIKSVEELYVKVKDPKSGKYIVDYNNDDIHGRFLRMKNQLVAEAPKKPQNVVPTKIYEPDKNLSRYEPCKFETIKISEGAKSVIVFDNGKGVKNIAGKETVHATIYYQIDSAIIEGDGEKKLNNILRFLLEHQHFSLTIEGHACVIGKMEYNQSLSQKRSDIVKKFFSDGGLDPKRIKSIGRGEVNPTDDKNGRDNAKYKDGYEYQTNRRVDISFDYFPHDAQTIIYQTIAPSVSTKKDITINVEEFDTKACFHSKALHKKEISMVDVGQAIDAGDTKKVFSTPSFGYKLYSNLSEFNALPIKYIWPAANNPNQFHMHVHSCRYYSNNKRTTVLIKVYPDIKWTLSFTLNLTNDLSVKWMNMDPHEHKELQKRSGKIGAEKRWKQKEGSIDFSLKAKWDNDQHENELKYKYETKFKKIYDTFASIGALSDGITNKAKGKVRSISPKGIPVSFAVKPPNLELSGNWLLKNPKDNNRIIGTEVAIGLKATPLIGLEMTVDLLGALVFAVSGAVSGGTAAPGVTRLYQEIQGKLKSGIDVGDDNAGFKASVDIYMDLIISSIIEVDSNFTFNTAGKLKDSDFKISSQSKLKVELKVGVKIQGEVSLAIVKAEAYFEASASGSASVTFGHGVNYDEKGLYYRPVLGFDGLDAQYLVTISVGLAIKIAKNKHKVEESRNGKYEIAKGEYKNVIPPFDVIKELENYLGIDANIPLIKND